MHWSTIGLYIGRLSADYRSTVGRLSVYCRSTIGWLSVDCRPIVGWLPTDSRPIYRSIVGLYVGRLSAYMSTEATYSTHDPVVLGGFRPFHVSVLTLARVRLLYQKNFSLGKVGCNITILLPLYCQISVKKCSFRSCRLALSFLTCQRSEYLTFRNRSTRDAISISWNQKPPWQVVCSRFLHLKYIPFTKIENEMIKYRNLK